MCITSGLLLELAESLRILCHERLGGPGVCGMACTLKHIRLYPRKDSALYGAEVNRSPDLEWNSNQAASVLGQREHFCGRQDFGWQCVVYPTEVLYGV